MLYNKKENNTVELNHQFSKTLNERVYLLTALIMRQVGKIDILNEPITLVNYHIIKYIAKLLR